MKDRTVSINGMDLVGLQWLYFAGRWMASKNDAVQWIGMVMPLRKLLLIEIL